MVGSPVFLIEIPLLAAFLIPLLGMVWKESVRIIPGLVLAYLTFLSANLYLEVIDSGTIVETIAGWQAPWGINLVFSPLTGFLATIMTFMGFIVWLYSYRFKRNVEFEAAKKYFIFLMLLVAGSIGIVITGDIFNQFVFIEIVGISAYALTAFYTGRNSAEAAFKYLIMGSLSASALLIAIIIVYSQLGTLNMAEIAANIDNMDPQYRVIAMIFFIIGIGVEAEIFPLNGWAPDAYTEAPGPVGGAFAGIVVKAGIYAMVRMMFTLFNISGPMQILIVIGLVTLIIAETSAMRQVKLKRMLAYSSIGQMGLVLVAFGMGTEAGVFAALFLMLNHAIIKPLLFLSGSFLTFNTTDKYIKQITGMAKKMPVVSVLFALGALAISGLPPFSGFWSKFSVLMAAAGEGLILIITLVLIISVIEIVYYFRVINRLFFFEYDEKISVEPHKPGLNGMVALYILAALILLIGFFPSSVTGFLDLAAEDLMNTHNYIDNVLQLGQSIIQ
jgi:proton-translocating NADH-quinone oxidoreductase chain N